MIPLRLYAYIAAGLLLAGLLGYGAHIVKKANRADAAETALAIAQKDFAASVERLSTAAAVNRQIAADLALYRDEQAATSADFRVELSKRNITREVRYETKQGESVVCTERDPVRYSELFNRAVGPASP